MSLKEKLEEKKAGSRQVIPAEALEVMDAATVSLKDSGLAGKALGVGEKAPGFILLGVLSDEVSLDSLLAEGPVVLSFYRGAWCPYCNLELAALRTALPEIEKAGAKLIAISPQTPDNSLETVKKSGVEFEVLSDVGNVVARSYGLVFALPESLRRVYSSFGIDLEKVDGDDSWELPLPATYVIDKSGIVRYAFAEADYTKRAEPADVLEALKAIS
ncbi:alkyl hydroperoxide reductase [Fulvitalea axinellae]|uniref:thioredoxin-dependent peroxiredoxin n=1 Tax=Fulvitalea axinellae TaxID=1182444 RepID=A0AAU9CT89_9BACT|nr:alkyl hydroperoxide reductase [Fulvitalea axinellae]